MADPEVGQENTNESSKNQIPVKKMKPFSKESAEYLKWKKTQTKLTSIKKSSKKVQKDTNLLTKDVYDFVEEPINHKFNNSQEEQEVGNRKKRKITLISETLSSDSNTLSSDLNTLSSDSNTLSSNSNILSSDSNILSSDSNILSSVCSDSNTLSSDFNSDEETK